MIREKLRSQKGATFIIAMVYFLICMMVGAVMITAASVDRGKSATTVIEQRDYYAVQSAALLFRDAIAGISFYDEFEYYGQSESLNGDKKGSPDEFLSDAGYLIIKGKKDNTDGAKAPYRANARYITGGEDIAAPKLTGVAEDSVFTPLYTELAKFFRYSFIKKIGMVDQASDLGANIVNTPYFSGTITLKDSIPVNYKLSVTEDDFTIHAVFYTGTEAPDIGEGGGADPADPDDTQDPNSPADGGDASVSKRNYSISLAVKPLDSSIKRSTDKKPDPENSVERRTVEYFVLEQGGNDKKDTYNQKSFVIDKATINLRFSNAALSRGAGSSK